MKKHIILIVAFFICCTLHGQSEERVKETGIKTKNTWTRVSSSVKYLAMVEKFDSKGNLIEEIDYTKDKQIKTHFVWTYNSNNDKLTETELDASGNVKKKVIYEYNGLLKISKKEYDSKNKLVSWKEYTYEK